MRLIQFTDERGDRAVAADTGDGHRRVRDAVSVYDLAWEAISGDRALAELVAERRTAEPVAVAALEGAGRLLPPLDHPRDPAHMLVTGTGLSHLGSAEGRDKMHRDLAEARRSPTACACSNSGSRAASRRPGQRACSRSGSTRATAGLSSRPGEPLESPSFALDGGEEPEIVGLYLIGPDGQPWRVGFALGNEFSDHVTEQQNYLYLAHSKLRACSIGPELLVGDLPADLRGTSASGAAARSSGRSPSCRAKPICATRSRTWSNTTSSTRSSAARAMSMSHFFGTSTLSFSDGFKTLPGDVFEIEMAAFGRPLRNALMVVEATPVSPRAPCGDPVAASAWAASSPNSKPSSGRPDDVKATNFDQSKSRRSATSGSATNRAPCTSTT